MSLTVTQRPSILYNSEVSRWNALRTPVLYKMQRKDFTFNQVNNSGGFVQLQFNAIDLTTSFDVGSLVHIKSDNNVYDIFGTVTARAFSTNTTVTIDQSYISAAPGGFVNNFTLRFGYKVEVNVYNLDNELINEEPFWFPASTRGLVSIDVATIIKNSLTADIPSDLTGSEEVFEDTDYTGFYIKYRELWSDSAESQIDDVANQFYGVLAALQIPSLYGGNLAVYAVPDVLFLTRFDAPVMWRGYPFLLSAIVNEEVASDVVLSTDDDDSAAEDLSGKLVHFDLNQIISDQDIDAVDVAIYEETSPGNPISEVKTIEMREACDNPVMLMARNSLGGVVQWLFDTNQDLSYEDDNSIKSKHLVLFTDNLTINQWEALQDFITLGEVYRNNITEFTSETIKTSTRMDQQVYVVYPDGTKVGVIVLPGRNKTQTRQVKHSFEIEIEFPEVL